jgi:predicted AAA+ superfamily ATPase
MEIRRDIVDLLLSRLAEEPNFIQAVIGPRQVGKTTAVKQVLSAAGLPSHYISCDLTSPGDIGEIENAWLFARRQGGVLVIDEIQKVERWSSIVKKLFDEDRPKKRLHVIILGSSSLNLARGLSESLAGRFELVRAHHWSYLEMQRGFGFSFESYLKYGGYPSLVATAQEPPRWQSLLRDSIIEPVISRDILSQVEISNLSLFRRTLEFACLYPAQILSYDKIIGQLQGRGSGATVRRYLEILEGAFLIKLLSKYSTRPITVKNSSPKIIPLCPALLHGFSDPVSRMKDSSWFGRVIETAVGAYLSKLGGELYYWKERNHEVDFVWVKGEDIVGIEVSSSSSHTTLGLKGFSSQFPRAKTLLLNRQLGEELLRLPEKEGAQFILEMASPT